jgi:hypothetical protein
VYKENHKRENRKQRVNVNTLEDKLINNSIRCYGCILRMDKDRIPPSHKALNMKLKESAQQVDQDQDGNNRLGKMSYRRKEEIEEEEKLM